MNTAAALTAMLIALALGALGGWFAHAHTDNSSDTAADRQPHRGPAGSVDSRLVESLILVCDLPQGTDPRPAAAQGLLRAGVHRIPVTVGAMFDANFHQAVLTRSSSSTHAAGTIAEEIRPGWHSGTGVVRYAEVVVYADPPGRAI